MMISEMPDRNSVTILAEAECSCQVWAGPRFDSGLELCNLSWFRLIPEVFICTVWTVFVHDNVSIKELLLEIQAGKSIIVLLRQAPPPYTLIFLNISANMLELNANALHCRLGYFYLLCCMMCQDKHNHACRSKLAACNIHCPILPGPFVIALA